MNMQKGSLLSRTALQIKLMLCSAKDGLIFISFSLDFARSEVGLNRGSSRNLPQWLRWILNIENISFQISLCWLFAPPGNLQQHFSDLLVLYQPYCTPRLSGTTVTSLQSGLHSLIFCGLVVRHNEAESSLLGLLYHGEICVGGRYEEESFF